MRIRTVKPEFWISESVGRLTRDSRLTFIGLWSVADDHGRFRADPRYLAGQLYPYDGDGLEVITAALAELTREGSLTLYVVAGSAYGVLNGWKTHQKIDRPSAAKLPGPSEGQVVDVVELGKRREASPQTREGSCEDQGREGKGSGKGSGKGEEQGEGTAARRSKKPKGQVDLLPAPPPPPEAPPAPRPPTRIGKLHAFFQEQREGRFLLPPPHGLDLGEAPPDEPPDFPQSAAALAQWVKRWPELPADEQDARIRAVICAWLEIPYWVSPKDEHGKPSTPYPWGAFCTRKQFERACALAFPEDGGPAA